MSISFMPTEVQAQIADSIKNTPADTLKKFETPPVSTSKKPFLQSKGFKATVVPAVLISYGLTTIKNNGLYSSYNARRDLQKNFPNFHTTVDDYLVFAPFVELALAYTLQVKDPPLSEFKEIELRRTDFKAMVRVEREIYDFLWFAVEGGFRQYYRNRVFNDIGSRSELIRNDLAGTEYIGVELFVVPPRRLVERMKNR